MHPGQLSPTPLLRTLHAVRTSEASTLQDVIRKHSDSPLQLIYGLSCIHQLWFWAVGPRVNVHAAVKQPWGFGSAGRCSSECTPDIMERGPKLLLLKTQSTLQTALETGSLPQRSFLHPTCHHHPAPQWLLFRKVQKPHTSQFPSFHSIPALFPTIYPRAHGFQGKPNFSHLMTCLGPGHHISFPIPTTQAGGTVSLRTLRLGDLVLLKDPFRPQCRSTAGRSQLCGLLAESVRGHSALLPGLTAPSILCLQGNQCRSSVSTLPDLSLQEGV